MPEQFYSVWNSAAPQVKDSLQKKLGEIIRLAKSGLSLENIQELAFVSFASAGTFSTKGNFKQALIELEKVYLCSWMLEDRDGLSICLHLLAHCALLSG